MKKFLILLGTLALTLSLAGCTKEVEVEVEVEVEKIVYVEIELDDIPTDLDMDNIDDFLGRPDVQYVDLRDFDDKMSSGYIAGFEFIPFFQYLEATEILVKTDGDWYFAAEDILLENALKSVFDDTKTIFLMCGSGTRAGYVKDALVSIGYTNVINIGGIGAYTGTNLVPGDETYNLELQLPLPTVVDMSNIDMYLGRSDVQYVDLRNFDDKMSSGYIAGFEFIPFFQYLEATEILVKTDGDWVFAAEDIMSAGSMQALFDNDKAIFLMCGSGTRAGFVKDALESLGFTNVYNIGGIGSYVGENLVSGDGVYNVEVIVPGNYTPGVYFGSSDSLYTAVLVINNSGGIQSVFFDAVTCLTDADLDGTKESDCTTKQTLGFDYNMVTYSTATLEWFEQADELAAAIVLAQGWSVDWAVVTEHFDPTDQEVIDDVAGVTIGIDGFLEAYEDALDQATPAS